MHQATSHRLIKNWTKSTLPPYGSPGNNVLIKKGHIILYENVFVRVTRHGDLSKLSLLISESPSGEGSISGVASLSLWYNWSDFYCARQHPLKQNRYMKCRVWNHSLTKIQEHANFRSAEMRSSLIIISLLIIEFCHAILRWMPSCIMHQRIQPLKACL